MSAAWPQILCTHLFNAHTPRWPPAPLIFWFSVRTRIRIRIRICTQGPRAGGFCWPGLQLQPGIYAVFCLILFKRGGGHWKDALGWVQNFNEDALKPPLHAPWPLLWHFNLLSVSKCPATIYTKLPQTQFAQPQLQGVWKSGQLRVATF